MASFPTSLPASSAEGVLNHGQVYDELYAALVAIGISSVRKIGLIAVTSYNPTLTTTSTTSATYVDIDATNVALTFTAPPSGNVLLVAVLNLDNAVGNQTASANLRDAGGDISGTDREVCFGGARNFGSYAPMWYLTGLTPGTSYTRKIGFARTVGSTSAIAHRVGGIAGAFVMAAVAA